MASGIACGCVHMTVTELPKMVAMFQLIGWKNMHGLDFPFQLQGWYPQIMSNDVWLFLIHMYYNINGL